MKSRHGWKEGTKIEARLTGDSQKKMQITNYQNIM